MKWTELFNALLIAVLTGMQILQNYDAERKEHNIREMENKLAKLESSTTKRFESLEETIASLKQFGGQTEVVFLIDWSRSISDKDFTDSLIFVRNVPDLFGKNWDKYTYSILLFNETVHSHFNGQFENGRRQLDDVVSGITCVKGGTDIAYALRYVQSLGHAFTSFGPNTHKFLFIITDGGNTSDKNDISDIEKKANKLKSENGVHIFTIGVKNKKYNSVIEKISSNPKDYFHHFLGNTDMQKIESAIKIVLGADRT